MIVLDTHIWLWWIARDELQLKLAWRERIISADGKFPLDHELQGRLLS